MTDGNRLPPPPDRGDLPSKIRFPINPECQKMNLISRGVAGVCPQPEGWRWLL